MLAPVEENDFEGCKTRCVCRSHRPFLRAAAAAAAAVRKPPIVLRRPRRRKSLSPEKFASPGARFPEGRWTFCSIACKIAGITKKEPRMLTAARVRSVERAKIADKLIPAPVAAAPPPALAVPPKAKWKARAKGEAPAPAPAPAPKPAAKKPPAKAKAKAKKPPAKAKSPPAPPVAVTKRRSARTTKARDVVTTAAAAAAADALITLARETETETTSEETTTPAKHRTPEPRRVLRSKDNAANVERGTSSSDKVAAAAVAPPCFEGSFAFAPGSHLSSERDEDGRLLRGGGDSISLGLDLAAAARMGAAANTPPALSRMTREADTPGFGYVRHEPTRAPDSAGSSLLIHNYGIVASPGIISVPRPRPRKSGKGKSTAAAAAAAAAALRIVTPPMPYLDDGSGLPFGELTDVTPTEPPATLAKKEGKKRQKTMKVSPMGSPR